MNSEMVDKLNGMAKELTSKIDNSESRLFSKLELELKPLVNQTFEKILDATIARYHARMSEIFEKDSTSLHLSHQKMDYMIQQIQSMDSRLEKLESKLEPFTHENEKIKESLHINSDISVETEDSATTVSESDTIDESSILELDETDRIQVSDTVVMFSRKNLTKHHNVYEGEMSSGLLGIRRCAIKFPRESSQRDEEVIILEKLGSHTHVNCLIQSGFFDNGLFKSRFLVLELCYKENLDQFLRDRPYNLQQRLEYCTQIIKGMNYVHRKMIIHKDLKPANILLTLNLQCIKIADFGISQEIQSERSRVYCENCFGTIGYHPPESFGNDYISLKSDIFSLGVLFHFVMTEEESPFGPESDLWDSNIKKGNVDIALQFVPNPIAFSHLFKLMMSTDRRSRPTIRQVEKHPCWTLQEEECDFDSGFMDEVDLGSEKRDLSQLEDADSIDDHGRVNEMLLILDPIENEIKEKKSRKEMEKEKSNYGFMDEGNLGIEKRDSSQLEDVDSIDDHGRLMEMLSILDPIEKEIKKQKSSEESEKEKSTILKIQTNEEVDRAVLNDLAAFRYRSGQVELGKLVAEEVLSDALESPDYLKAMCDSLVPQIRTQDLKNMLRSLGLLTDVAMVDIELQYRYEPHEIKTQLLNRMRLEQGPGLTPRVLLKKARSYRTIKPYSDLREAFLDHLALKERL